MRLISCYIKGFGKLCDRSFDLSKDIVEISTENGWGKTTLLAFIESMLFGLDASRSKSVAENARLKYEPFGGGGFGGSLTFFYEGQEYRLERTFGKTPSLDTVRIYDKNNLPSWTFGENIANIGELLFGVNKESYHKSAYIPQGEIVSENLPEDTKARLIALLSVDGNKQNGAFSAVQRLNQAESELRSKRAPKKGLLDKIDEKLAAIEQEKRVCQQAALDVYALQKEIAGYAVQSEQLSKTMLSLSAQQDAYMQRSERAAARARRQELERQLVQTEERLDRLRVFFKDVEPQAVNVDGIQAAVKEYYEIAAWLKQYQPQMSALAQEQSEQQGLLAKLQDCEQRLQSFERMLDEQNKAKRKAYKDSQKQEKKIQRGKHAHTLWLMVALVVLLIGATQLETMPALGWPLVGLGGGFIVFRLLAVIIATKFWKRPKYRKSFEDKELNAQYKQVQEEYEALKIALAGYAVNGMDAQTLLREMQAREQRAAGLQAAIESFLGNFAFDEMYDYRAALSMLQDKREAYMEIYKQREACMQECTALPQVQEEVAVDDSYAAVQLEDLKKRAQQAQADKQLLVQTMAHKQAALTALEQKACAIAEYKAEETQLLAEKARLERKLTAIQTARTLLERARENMAARYLEPVEARSAAYLREWKSDFKASLKFAADGQPLMDDSGALRSLAYYSQGTRELIGFCVRLALMETMYQKQLPVLMLDDPFVHFDDETTALCKRLLVRLSKKYQIIYCTCKEERKIK